MVPVIDRSHQIRKTAMMPKTMRLASVKLGRSGFAISQGGACGLPDRLPPSRTLWRPLIAAFVDVEFLLGFAVVSLKLQELLDEVQNVVQFFHVVHFQIEGGRFQRDFHDRIVTAQFSVSRGPGRT